MTLKWGTLPSSRATRDRARGEGIEVDLPLIFDAMVELVVLHEVVCSRDGAVVDYRFLDCNPAFTRTTGLPREQCLGRLASEVYGVPPPYLDIYARVAATGVPARFEAYFEPMGRHFTISVVSPRRGLFATVAADVTEQRRAEATAAAERERLAVTVRSIGDAVVATDAGGLITLFNAAAERLTGWTAAAALGRPLTEVVALVDEETRLPLTSPVERVLLEGAVVGFADDAVLLARDGTAHPVADSGAPIRDTGGTLVGTVLVLRDQTAQRSAQESARTERDGAAAARAALAENLLQAQKLETVGRLAGGVAHDFNNLLTVILACADALQEDLMAGAAPRLADVQEIHAAGQRARDLTRRLLAFSRKHASAPVALDVGAVVRGAEGLLRRILGEDVTLRVEVAPEPWPVRCDPGLLEQVIMNLSVNARDAMPGGGTLTLTVENVGVDPEYISPEDEAPGDGWVKLSARDTGTGIAPEVEAHLFEPFFTTKQPGHGTGLGLATVYGIVSQCGGHLHVKSEPGRGAVFEVWLPRTREEVRPAVPARAAAPARQGQGTERILVVEDDAQVRAVTTRILRGAGYQVATATDGPRALAMPEQALGEISLLVTDVVMPEMDGRVLAERLRGARPRLPVLYLSGYAPDRALDARGGPGLDFLPKPFTPAALLERVRSLLDAA